MNKLVNLIIIFLSLQYLIPLIKVEYIENNQLYKNAFAALIIGSIQMIYNIGMKVSKRKDVQFNDMAIDSLFKMMIVFGGIYIFEDIRASNIELIPNLQSSQFFRSAFITLIVTFFILIKCLITP